MAKLVKTQVTKHQRGFFGRIWQVAFWLFQFAMLALVVANFGAVGDQINTDCAREMTDSLRKACQAGTVIGGGIVAVGGWFLWFLGTVILGILMFATRGKLVTYQVED
ncbi:hypothetical protein [Albidovulum sp.]|uniref:hypothetical protein n=1 Tax=Albidovulum sp. TaxID=1872424 RepID=UPI0039B879AC